MRLFVAVHLPQEIRERLALVQERLRRAQADVSWVKPANLHITLKFLGETEPKRLERIGPVLAETARSAAPFSLARRNASDCFNCRSKANFRCLRRNWPGDQQS